MNYQPKISAEVDELFSACDDVDFAKSVRVLLDSGLPLTTADVDGLTTDSAGNRILTYHLSDPLKVLLTTFKAMNVDAIDMPVRN